MKTLSFNLSDEAYTIFEKEAEISEITVQELINKYFKIFEHYRNDPEGTRKYLESVKRSHLDKKSRKMYDTHPLQEYILAVYPGTRINKKTIAWRTCPVQPDQEKHREYDSDAFCNHIGEYWYQIRKYNKSSIAGIFREVDTTKTYYFKSLKALKRNINKVMGYSHYKVK